MHMDCFAFCFCYIIGLDGLTSTIWDLIQYKVSSYQYRKYHCGGNMILQSSYLHIDITYTDKKIPMRRKGDLTTDLSPHWDYL